MFSENAITWQDNGETQPQKAHTQDWRERNESALRQLAPKKWSRFCLRVCASQCLDVTNSKKNVSPILQSLGPFPLHMLRSQQKTRHGDIEVKAH